MLKVFHELLGMVPGLEEWLMGSSEDEVILIADLVSQLSLLSSMGGACTHVRRFKKV